MRLSGPISGVPAPLGFARTTPSREAWPRGHARRARAPAAPAIEGEGCACAYQQRGPRIAQRCPVSFPLETTCNRSGLESPRCTTTCGLSPFWASGRGMLRGNGEQHGDPGARSASWPLTPQQCSWAIDARPASVSQAKTHIVCACYVHVFDPFRHHVRKWLVFVPFSSVARQIERSQIGTNVTCH